MHANFSHVSDTSLELSIRHPRISQTASSSFGSRQRCAPGSSSQQAIVRLSDSKPDVARFVRLSAARRIPFSAALSTSSEERREYSAAQLFSSLRLEFSDDRASEEDEALTSAATPRTSAPMDDLVPMKLDGIAVAGPWTGRRLRRESSELAIGTLTRQLRKFFSEDDGHGSLQRKPPPSLQTPQYFKSLSVVSCYPVPKVHWMALVNASNYKKQFSPADNLVRVQRPKAILTPKARARVD